MANVPAHGELFIGGVMDEKCRIILHIDLPSSNGGLFAYQHTEMHRHAASLSSANSGNMQLLSLFFLFFLFLFFHSGSRLRRPKWAAFILEKEKDEEPNGLRLRI